MSAADAARVESALAVLDRAVAEHKPSHVFALFSGGHDSLTAASIAAKHPAFTATVFIDTGTAIPDTIQFVQDTVFAQDWPLLVYKAPERYEDIVLKYGFPGPASHGLMYRRLKERALDALIRDHKIGWRDRIALVSGVRTDESTRRMRARDYVHRDGASVWVPIIHDWTKADCNRHIEAEGLDRSPVADKIHRSGECNCGAFAAPGEMRELEFWFPAFANRLHSLEAAVELTGHPACVWGQRPPNVHREQMKLDVGPLCSSCETRAA